MNAAESEVIRQGVRTLRLTRPAGPVLHLAERQSVSKTNSSPTQDGDGLCTLARSAGVTQRIPARQGTRNTETIEVVPVIRLVVVAVCRTSVRRCIVERAATRSRIARPRPSGIGCANLQVGGLHRTAIVFANGPSEIAKLKNLLHSNGISTVVEIAHCDLLWRLIDDASQRQMDMISQ